ncbi:MAG: NAD(P)H-binding protein [Planctomycetota bacterium]|nr:NAD(P)H-binding protein [Planctomycetota bacterium]
MGSLHVVTGGLGYTGRSIVEQLLARGQRVRTLTNSPDRPHSFGDRIEIHPLAFEDPAALEASFRGVDVLYNTYWVRFNHRLFTFDQAVRNTRILFDAARRAGVRRIVHVSILHATEADDLGYYRGKHQLEDALRQTGLSHAIVRPGVLFGRFDILVNNIAWTLRHLPVFGVFGRGDYALRPMHVDDMAALMIRHAALEHNTMVDAVGPERFTFRELVTTIASMIGEDRAVMSVPPRVGWVVASMLNPIVRDVVITWEEVLGLCRGLLDSDQSESGPTRLTTWARANAATLGVRYASEVGRRVQRGVSYSAVR